MRCVIRNMTMEQHAYHEPIDILGRYDASEFVKPRFEIKADVLILGTPEEAREIMHSGREMEIRPADRFEKEDVKPTFDDIRKGDEVRYQFIRGAYGIAPEESQWMKVIAVDGDMITAVFNQEKFRNKYEFRVLRCQIIEHKCQEKRVKKKIKCHAPKAPNLPDPTPESDAVRIKVVANERIDVNDPVAALRRQVQEFNLE